MRHSTVRIAITMVCSAGFTLLSAALFAAGIHPIESELRGNFPEIPLQSTAIFERSSTFIGSSLTSGIRARPTSAAEPALSVLYPDTYDGLLVVELGTQRVVLRAAAASSTAAIESNGKLVYARPFPSTDAVEIPKAGRSEELLLLHDANAPLTFDYEIVATEGVTAVALDDGAVRFVPTRPAPSIQIDRPWVIDASGTRSESHVRWMLIGDGPIPDVIRLIVTPERLSFPLVIDPSFSTTGNLTSARLRHTATPLGNGKVLIVGGSYGSSLSSAELYDPARGTFSATGNLPNPHERHTATLLPNGKVLIAGGCTSPPGCKAAELYDPVAGTFSATGNLVNFHQDHTATLLPNGKVLIAGGYSTSAELYDPGNGTFAVTGSLATSRGHHTATLLPDGKVLIVGGGGTASTPAEIYNPDNGTFTPTGTPTVAGHRDGHTATLLPNGKVLIAGGLIYNGVLLTSAQLYDPTNGTFSATGDLSYGRLYHTATLLPNGKVFLAGGQGPTFELSSTDLYDPTLGTFTSPGSLAIARRHHTATLLPNGKVLIAAGYNNNSAALSSAELYDSASGGFESSNNLITARDYPTATLLPTGKALIVGGYHGIFGALKLTELYDPDTHAFSTGPDTATAHWYQTATLLSNGKVLVAGGQSQTGLVTSAELYDAGAFATTGPMAPRIFHTATLLPNGKVLLAGGTDGSASSTLKSAELYDPTASTFTATGDLSSPRAFHTATLLMNGKVLLAGGWNPAAAGYLNTAELYDPETGTFGPTGSMALPREKHTATLLPNGNVLIAGGHNSDTGVLTSAELYDTVSGTFSVTNGLATARESHTATLLPNGKVLVAGGWNSLTSTMLASAELYDPATRMFSATGALAGPHTFHAAILLRDGKVLIAGGLGAGGFLKSAELYDAGDGVADSRRPVITSAPATLTLPAAIAIAGTGFRGDSEASSGTTNSSPANEPVVRLQRIDNEQMFFVQRSAWTGIAFTSATLSGLPGGHYRASIITNGIPSKQSILAVVNPSFVAHPPVNVVAAATTSTSIQVTWSAAASATSYDVLRSANGTTFDIRGTVSSTSFTDSPVLANTAYLYKVRVSAPYLSDPSAPDLATTVIFTDPSLSPRSTKIQVVHLTQLRTAVAAVGTLAARPAAYTDPVITPGSSRVKAVYMTELREILNVARIALHLSAISFTTPPPEKNMSCISAAHVNDLRNGVR